MLYLGIRGTKTYCSIHKGFSVVFKSSIISFFINASFFLRSDGAVITLKLRIDMEHFISQTYGRNINY